MKIPKAEQTVGPNQVSVPTPEFSRPPVAAFGGDVAAAQERQGAAVSQIGDQLAQHMAASAKLASEEKAYELGQKINDFYKEKLYGDGVKEVIDPATKKTRQISTGIMRRTFHDAAGSALEIKQARAEADKLLEPYKGNSLIYHQAKRFADTHANSAYDSAIVHEATQRDLATKNTFINTADGLIRNLSNLAPTSDGKEEMKVTFDAIAKVEAVTGLSQEARRANAVQVLAMRKVGSDGNISAASDVISEYEPLLDKMEGDKIRMAVFGVARRKYEDAQFADAKEGTAQAVSVFQGLLTGKGLPSGDEIAASKMPLEWKTAMTAAIKDVQNPENKGKPATPGWFGTSLFSKPAEPGRYEQGVKPEILATPEKAVGVSDYAAEVLKTGSQQEQIQALLPVIADKSLSVDEKTALIELALQRNGGLQDVAHERDLDGTPKPKPAVVSLAQKAKDSVIQHVMSLESIYGASYPEIFRTVVQDLAKGKEPQQVLNTVTGKANLILKPEMAKFPKEGRLMRDNAKNVVRGFPDGHIEEVK